MSAEFSIGGDLARDRVTRSVANELRTKTGIPMPTDLQIASVLHALADHTLIVAALRWRPPEDGFWPEATSMGRFLHDLGDLFDGFYDPLADPPDGTGHDRVDDEHGHDPDLDEPRAAPGSADYL